jgi:hypothetical protein
MTESTPKPPLAGLKAELKAFADDLGGWVGDGVRRLGGAERRALVLRFGYWAVQKHGLGDAELRAWIGDLGADGLEALVDQLARFCADFELDLAWLVDGDLTDWPSLEAGVRQLATHYCLACKSAVDADEALQQFRRRRLWQHKLKAAT